MFRNTIRKVINELNIPKSNTLFHLLKERKNAGKRCSARTQKSEQSTHTSVMTSEDMQSIHNNASNLQQEYTSLQTKQETNMFCISISITPNDRSQHQECNGKCGCYGTKYTDNMYMIICN